MWQKKLLDRWLRTMEVCGFLIRFWDGRVDSYGKGKPKFKLNIKNKKVLGEILRQPSIGFGEAYMRGDIEIEGSFEELLKIFHGTGQYTQPNSLLGKVPVFFTWLKQKNRLGQAQKNISHHYDIGNEFYDLWLGKERMYSCAYFKKPEDSIDTAQTQKIEHICKKLFLKKDETLLDIGCGWGGVIINAAKKYGVKSHGITLSKEQHAVVTKRISDEGLKDQVTVEIVDYRELVKRGIQFDKVVSIGMFEHVGKENIAEYMKVTDKLMKSGSVGLLHTIGKMHGTMTDAWIQKYIFPGGYLPGIDEITTLMAKQSFRLRDVENLRQHYAMTLDLWLEEFEANLDSVRKMFDEDFIRMWRMYLLGSSTGFRYGNLDLWQLQFTKGLRNDLPITRDYLC
ncbi:MAG: cyclopropane-fatty-acyl-phospholipid synthase family protein [Patescibacteria group bacterium]